MAAANSAFHSIVLLRVLEELDVALDDFRPRDIAPAPELRRGRAGDAGDGGGVGLAG